MVRRIIFRRSVVLVFALAVQALGASDGGADKVHPTARLLQEVIQIDTSNPPGNEGKLAKLLESKFAPLGFEIDIIPTPEDGKAHFIARLRGDGSKKPVLLAAHADVVGVEREKWSVDPFEGVIKNGFVYGRGAIDFKGGLAVFARAVMMLAENKVPLARDVIFLSEADEEGGRYDTRWLADGNWDKIDCEFALNEGGWIIKDDSGKVQYVSISTADKSAISLLLTAKGTSTHSSMPRRDNAIFTLARAMSKIADYDTKPYLIDSTKQFFSTLAKTSPEPMSSHFRALVDGTDAAAVAAADKAISENVLLHAIMRNTIAPVFLDAGFRGNVIPGSATATINFRTIPGANPDDLIEEIKTVIDDPRVEITYATSRNMSPEVMRSYIQAMRNMKPSTEDTELYKALAENAKEVFPEAEVTSYLFQAGTDAFAWRSKGIPVYGTYPYPIDAETLTTMHGNDERVPVESLAKGTEMIYKTLLDVAAKENNQ